MCISCWIDYGSPEIDNPKVRAAVEAIQAADGDLPPLLDDYNVEDDHLDSDIRTAQEWIGKHWSEGHARKVIHAISMLGECTPTERISALACVDEYWKLS